MGNDEEVQKHRRLPGLAATIERMTGQDGIFPTAVETLHLARASRPTEPIPAVYKPSLCLIAQGSKQMMLGKEVYRYDSSRCLLVTVDLPVIGQVVEATPQTPYLSLHLGIDPQQISSLMTEVDDAQAERAKAGPPHAAPKQEAIVQEQEVIQTQAELIDTGASARGISVGCVDFGLLDAVTRLLRLLETPRHIPVLAPLIQREILYLLLMSEQGAALRRIAQANPEMQGIVEALHRLKHCFAEPLRIDDLAHQVHMSPSRFHLHFKAVTALTPLQYQKRLRLQEARRLMLAQDLDAASAGFQVGYESPSQFSREYRRLFGDSPQRDRTRLRSHSPAVSMQAQP